ncbi:MAG: hypothetical protein HKN11_16945, partial [Rhizobiales bacterium]|nr:hypothetical protein [Hyphomicrobiales bacterium]
MTGKRLFAVFLPDMILAVTLMCFAIFSASRIIIALSVLCVMTLIQDAWTYAIRQSETKGSFRHYEYGIGKLEQAVNLTIAVTMILAGLWLVNMVLGSQSGGGRVTTQRDLVLAAMVSALYTLRHACLACAGMIARRDASGKAGAAGATTSRGRCVLIAVTQLVITSAVLARDPLF